MCGIHGFINAGQRQTKADEFMIMSFTANSVRGLDASGIATIDTVTKSMGMQKLPVPGYYFMQNPYARALARGANAINTITIGHVRASTSSDKGGIPNAHPFTVTDSATGRELVGVHNGTLYPWRGEVNASRYEVDSEWALNHIFAHGMDAFKDIQGSYCFVWWDSDNPNILNMALNKERPMHFAMVKDGGMAYASEAGMLAWMLEKNGLERTTAIKRLMPNNWYKFDITSLTEYTKEAIPVPPVAAVTTHSRNDYARTTIDNVDAFLTRIGVPVPGVVEQLDRKAYLTKPMTTPEEVENAKTLLMLGEEGCFQPWWDDDNDICGTWTGRDGAECTALMRHSHHLNYNNKTMWMVKCIGIQDDGKSELTIVCSRPIVDATTAEVPETNQEMMH